MVYMFKNKDKFCALKGWLKGLQHVLFFLEDLSSVPSTHGGRPGFYQNTSSQ